MLKEELKLLLIKRIVAILIIYPVDIIKYLFCLLYLQKLCKTYYKNLSTTDAHYYFKMKLRDGIQNR